MTASDARTRRRPQTSPPSPGHAVRRPTVTGSRRVGAVVAGLVAPLRDHLDARVISAHAPTVDDDSVWCTRHFGGLEVWPCRDYADAAASLGARRRQRA